MRGCIEHHAPKLPKCVGELFSCLNDAGLRSRDATREEIAACVQSAHMCFREGLSQRRGARADQGDDDDQSNDEDQQRSRFGRRGRR